MKASRLPDGTLKVPRRAESPSGTIGDGLVTIDQDDPEFTLWDEYLTRKGE